MNTINLYNPLNTFPPYTVEVCDIFGNNCVFVASFNTNIPPTPIQLPPPYETAPALQIKITDFYGCVVSKNFYCGYATADRICKCDSLNNQNIYIFYDATSMDSSVASGASQSFRAWYTGATTFSGYTGFLYEGVIGKGNDNGENWMWWGTYPYLGSLTGGTLSDGTPIKAFGSETTDVVLGTTGSTSNFCQGGTDPCRPTIASFNDDSTEPVYQQINRGQDFITSLSLSGSGIMGVPFDKTALNGSSNGIYGYFSGGDLNYTTICVIDESDGVVGLYTSTASMTAFTSSADIFRLRGATNPNSVFTGTSTTAELQPSSRFSGEYGKFLQVWEDIQDNSGSFNGLIYPIAKSGAPWTFNFIHHVIAAIEGQIDTALYFSQKYDRNGAAWPFINPILNNDDPTAYNFSGLQTYNTYSTLASLSQYSNLNSQYKNGPGLKNFGWFTDPTVSAFTDTIVKDALDNFVSRTTAGNNCEYVLSNVNLNLNKIYYFDSEVENGIKGCYQVTQKSVVAPNAKNSIPLSLGVDFCFQCSNVIVLSLGSSLRFSSGFTFGYNTGAVKPPNNVANLMWSNPSFYDVLTGNGVNYIRYPGGTKATYWDWTAGTFVTTTEYSRLPFTFLGLTTTPATTLEFYASAATAYNINTIFMLNDYLRPVDDQMNFLFSAQSLGLNVDFIEIGQEYYLAPGADFVPDVNSFIVKFPTGGDYALSSMTWIYSAQTLFSSNNVCIVGCIESGTPTSRRRIWNQRVAEKFNDAVYNPNSIYPNAISLHSYVLPGPTSYGNINTWVFTTLNDELGDITNTIDNFNTYWLNNPPLDFWISEFGVTDKYNTIAGTWAHGQYLLALLLKLSENSQITLAVNNSLFSGRDYGMMFSFNSVFGSPGTSNRFDLSAGGLLLGYFNRAFNNSTTFQSLDFGTSEGIYGKNFSGGTFNSLIMLNVVETSLTLDISGLLSPYTIQYYLILSAQPTLRVNYIDPSTLVKDFPTVESGTTISNLVDFEVPAFSFVLIEYV